MVSNDKERASKRRSLRGWLRVVIYPALFYLLWCIMLFFSQDRILFPQHAVPAAPTKVPLYVKQVWIENDLGQRIEALYLPPAEDNKGPQPAVIFCHGNAELADFYVAQMEPYRQWGMGVLLPEYPGYGRSQGSPGQESIAQSMEQFYQWLIAQPEVDSSRIVYHGRSVGGGAVCDLASTHPPAALILQSTFTSVVAMSRRYLVPGFLIQHPFRNDQVVSQLECPIFIAHGTIDRMIDVEHARRLHKLAKNSTYYEAEAGHNDFPMKTEFWQRIRSFLEKAEVLESRD